MKTNNLFIVVPCFNEEFVISAACAALSKILEILIIEKHISKESRIVFVDDGSNDNSWEIIQEKVGNCIFYEGIKLSRNFGHQNALLAGLSHVIERADTIVTIDADLQDDPTTIIQFIDKYERGFDVVYGVRRRRDTDTFFKRNTANIFYKIMRKLGVHLVPNHADFRLLSKRAARQLLDFHESTIFLRGLVPLVGFPATKVYYDRGVRKAGESKYPLKKMISFSIEGLTSFSISPIKAIFVLGIVALFISFVITLYSLIRHFLGYTVSGWTSLMVSFWVLGGLQLISISTIGIYIGKVFIEVKGRPRFIIEEKFVHLSEEKER